MVRREELEKGGTAYFKTPQHCTLVTIKDFNRNGVRVQMSNGREVMLTYNQLVPDNEFLAEREKREREKRQRIASEREPTPLTHKLPMPGPMEQAGAPFVPQLQLLPPPERLIEPDNAEATRRMVALFRWLMVTRYGNKRGAVSRVNNDLGLSNVSQMLQGADNISIARAEKALARVGFDSRYLRLAEFVPPDQYKPVPVAAPPESAPVHEEPLPRPEEKVTAAPAAVQSKMDRLRDELRAWREMSPLASVDRELADNLMEIAAVELRLADLRKTQGELTTMRAALVNGPEGFEAAAAE